MKPRAACLRRALLTVRLSQACARLSSAADAASVSEASSRSRPAPDTSALAFLNDIASAHNVFAPADQPQMQKILTRPPPDAAVSAAATAVAQAEATLTTLIQRFEAGRSRGVAKRMRNNAAQGTSFIEGEENATIQRTSSQGDAMATDGPNSPQGDATATKDGPTITDKADTAQVPQSIQDSLRVFEQEVQPLLRKARPGDYANLFAMARQFLNAVRKQVVDAGITGFSVRLSRLCNSIGDWRLDTRNEMVLSLCHTIIKADTPRRQKHHLVKELVDMWKHISQCRRPSQTREPNLRFTLPSSESIITNGQNAANNAQDATKSFNVALASIFNQHSLETACSLVPGLLVTLAILSDKEFTTSSVEGETATLLNMVAAALPQDAERTDYLKVVLEQPKRFSMSRRQELHAYTLAQWPQAVNMLCVPYSTWRTVLAQEAKSRRQTSDLAIFHRQLRAAYKVSSKGGVASVWESFQDRLKDQPDLLDQLAGMPDFVDFWLFVWCAMRLPQMVEQTLSLMHKAKMEPTVRSYTAMIHGWKLCKDYTRINELWKQIIRSGIRLDAAIWTERISVLVESRKVQEALQVLGELQARWKRAVQNNGGNAQKTQAIFKPTIEMVNAVLGGVLAMDKKAAFRVLAWAEGEGIQANVRTYNALLREAFRTSGSGQAVQTIFSTMHQNGIEPDGATFTLCLEEILGTMCGKTGAEQVAAVRNILADVTKAGLRVNGEMYGKMVYAVSLLPGGGSDAAIAAVEQHMQAASLKTTPHMVTILLERFIARSPSGDFEDLLQRHGFNHVSKGDQTLWERVMSARAKIGRCDAALALFDQLAQAGRPVTSLSCLNDLLSALLQGESPRLQDARRIVDVVVTYKMSLVSEKEGLGGVRYWRHHFWQLARKHDLLPWNKLSLDLQQYFGNLNCSELEC